MDAITQPMRCCLSLSPHQILLCLLTACRRRPLLGSVLANILRGLPFQALKYSELSHQTVLRVVSS